MNVPPAITAKSGIRTKSHRRGGEIHSPLGLEIIFFRTHFRHSNFRPFRGPFGCRVGRGQKQFLTIDRGICLADL